MILGIDNLISPLQNLIQGNTYIIAADTRSAAVNLGLCCLLKHNDSAHMKYLVLNDLSREEILKNFSLPEKLAEIRAHVYVSNNSLKFLSNIVTDFEYYHAVEQDALFVILTSDRVLFEGHTSSAFSKIKKMVNFFREIKAAALVITYGDHQDSVINLSQQRLNELGGAASLMIHSDCYLESYFWKDETGRLNNGRTELTFSSNGFAAVLDISKVHNPDLIDDIDTCYVCNSGFAPDKEIFSKTIELPDNLSVFNRAQAEGHAATCFFVIHDRTEVEELGKMIFKLRHSTGMYLHIFVLEKVANIRANSENFLLACGANYVFTAEAQISHINVMLHSLHKATFKYSSAVDFAVLKRQFFMLDRENNGYLDKDEFVKKVASLVSLEDDGANCNGALAILAVNQKISSELAVSQFKPKRGGDYCTIFHQDVVVFLPSCREGELSVSLLHTFNVETDKLFSSIRATYTKHEIISIINEMKNDSTLDDLNYELLLHTIEIQKMEKNYGNLSDKIMTICEKTPIVHKTISSMELK